MTYAGTITTSYPDPDLILTATLDDGSLLHILHDRNPQSPEEWDEPATLVLTGESRRRYHVGQVRSTLHAYLLDAAAHFGHQRRGEEMVTRYMRLFHGVEVQPVSLTGSCQSDWAEGYLVLDNLHDDIPRGGGREQQILKCCALEWEAYWSGDVFGFIHTDAEGEELDSCWGFYLGEGDDLEKFARGLAYGHVDGEVVEVEWR